jgi:hypothetical protein
VYPSFIKGANCTKIFGFPVKKTNNVYLGSLINGEHNFDERGTFVSPFSV